MAKKDYVAIAAAITSARATGGDADTLCRVAEELSSVFQAGNPKFSKSTFMEACGFSVPSLRRLPAPGIAGPGIAPARSRHDLSLS